MVFLPGGSRGEATAWLLPSARGPSRAWATVPHPPPSRPAMLPLSGLSSKSHLPATTARKGALLIRTRVIIRPPCITQHTLHLKTFDVITSAKSLLPGKVTYAQVGD